MMILVVTTSAAATARADTLATHWAARAASRAHRDTTRSRLTSVLSNAIESKVASVANLRPMQTTPPASLFVTAVLAGTSIQAHTALALNAQRASPVTRDRRLAASKTAEATRPVVIQVRTRMTRRMPSETIRVSRLTLVQAMNHLTQGAAAPEPLPAEQ